MADKKKKELVLAIGNISFSHSRRNSFMQIANICVSRNDCSKFWKFLSQLRFIIINAPHIKQIRQI